jgi:tRNA threonylcarbamoyladenosine biosynthesis protein TsaE
MQQEMICKNIEEMYAAAAELAGEIKPGQVITFEGPLGAGKTTFIQGLLKAWGYSDPVTSPTFALVHEYQDLCYQGQSFNAAHFDLYRLTDSQELEGIGFRDYLDDQTICLIEWPSQAQDYLPQADIHLILDQHPNGRSIKLCKV